MAEETLCADKAYLLWVCPDDAPELTERLEELFHEDPGALLAELESAKEQPGSFYYFTDIDEHGESFVKEEHVLLMLKGKAFDEQFCKDDIYMAFRTPDGDVQKWKY